jgi:hypothetical protein
MGYASCCGKPLFAARAHSGHLACSACQEMVCEEPANHPDSQCLTALHADETGSFMFTGTIRLLQKPASTQLPA